MTKKTVTMYSKTIGCQMCKLTKRAFEREGVLDKIKIIYIDQPENSDILENLKEQGLISAPIIMTNFPVELNGEQITEWTGLVPEAVKQASAVLKEGE